MDLQTNYLGIKLKNPLIVSSCPLSEKIANIKAMEAAGAAAVVMYSIFEEEIKHSDEFVDYYLHYGTDKFAESLTYFPNMDKQSVFLSKHLDYLHQAVASVDIPIIGSLNAITMSGWIDYALQMQDTGIKGLELNLHNSALGNKSATEIETYYLNIVQELKHKLHIPLAIKLNPFFTSIEDMAQKLANIAKVDGLVIFDRFYYPDINIDTLEFSPNIRLSDSYDARLSIKWISALYGKLNASLIAATGVEDSSDVIKYILAGADAVMCASCIIKNGIPHLESLLAGLTKYLETKQCSTIKDIQGLISNKKIANPIELERSQYMKSLRSFEIGPHFDK